MGKIGKGASQLWSKDFVILSAVNFFIALTFYLLATTLTLYAIEQFRAAESKAGLASSIFIVGALVSRFFAGRFVELIGRRKMLHGGMLLYLISTLLYFPVHELNVLMAVRFVNGFAFGVAATAIATAVMNLIPNDRRGEGTSYFALSATASAAIGPLLGLVIVQHADFTVIFLCCAAFSLAGFILAAFAAIPEESLTREQKQALRRGLSFRDFFEPNALPISLLMLVIGVAYSGILSFLNPYAVEIGLTEAAGLFFTVYAIFVFLSRPFSGKLLDAKGDNIVMVPAMVLFASSLLLLGAANSGFALLAAGALSALGYATLVSCGQAITIKLTPKHRYGLATSTFYVCIDGGLGIGPFLLGMLVPIVHYRGMFLILAVLTALTIIPYYLVHGKHAKRRQHPIT